jgi:signal peptidase II
MLPMAKLRKGLWIWGGAIPALIVAFDQLTKYWAVNQFNESMNVCELGDPRIPTIEFGPIFDLSLVCNRGVSFGLFSNSPEISRIVFTIFAVLMSGFLITWLNKEKDKLLSFSIALIIGGAVGNAIDRALFGAVTDFIDTSDFVRIGEYAFKWVFNVADSAITIGVIGLLGSMFLQGRREKAAGKAIKNSQ